jgi:hypothetical protein
MGKILKVTNPMQFNLLDCVKSHLENSDLHFDDIAPIVIPENHPWLNPNPIFNFELTKYKKYYTNPSLIQLLTMLIRLRLNYQFYLY